MEMDVVSSQVSSSSMVMDIVSSQVPLDAESEDEFDINNNDGETGEDSKIACLAPVLNKKCR